MKFEANEFNLLKKLASELQGVFTETDLKIMFPSRYKQPFYLMMKRLERLGLIERFVKGIYITPDFKLELVSQKICENSYISFEYILEKNGVIGNRSKDYLRCVKVGKRRDYKFKKFQIKHLSINKNLFFDFEAVNGINYASPEKAFLDVLYFYSKGEKFYFDIYSDLNINFLNLERVEKLLKKYKNPKFVTFVKGYIKNENSR